MSTIVDIVCDNAPDDANHAVRIGSGKCHLSKRGIPRKTVIVDFDK